jgi:hypothetical protein
MLLPARQEGFTLITNMARGGFQLFFISRCYDAMLAEYVNAMPIVYVFERKVSFRLSNRILWSNIVLLDCFSSQQKIIMTDFILSPNALRCLCGRSFMGTRSLFIITKVVRPGVQKLQKITFKHSVSDVKLCSFLVVLSFNRFTIAILLKWLNNFLHIALLKCMWLSAPSLQKTGGEEI